MRYLYALAASVLLFLAMIGPSITINTWQKLLYDKEPTEKEKKKDFRVGIVLWAILTFVVFVITIFFVD